MYMIKEGIDVIHYCCMDVVDWKRQEIGLKRSGRLSVVGLFGFYAVLRIRIRMFLGLLDPDPSITKQKKYEKPLLLLLCDFFLTFYL
jgi:hypothetical protein